MKIILGIVGSLILLLVVLVAWLRAKNKREWAEAEAAKGQPVGTWKVYYDTTNKRVGLQASFGEEHLLRFLVFRLHDLLSYYAGLAGEQGRLINAVREAASGQGAEWTLLFPPPEEELFHNQERPKAPLRYFFDGTLFEGEVSQPRFIGGDSIAKNEGLVGECVAIAGHLAQREPKAVSAAVESVLGAQMAEGDVYPGPRFWSRARAALDAAK